MSFKFGCDSTATVRAFLCGLLRGFVSRRLEGMEVHFTPEIQARLDRLAAESGRAKDELVQDAMPGYLDELERTRGMLDSRYDDVKIGRASCRERV